MIEEVLDAILPFANAYNLSSQHHTESVVNDHSEHVRSFDDADTITPTGTTLGHWRKLAAIAPQINSLK
jgi:hypothetical protein